MDAYGIGSLEPPQPTDGANSRVASRKEQAAAASESPQISSEPSLTYNGGGAMQASAVTGSNVDVSA